ncbi:hypothetical protein E2562_018903 [Oryza meyeriana var. granulata]|uniref:2-methoxy-6-polyprenyl-1,4-benzoquinol methylase, mitochondrial n=1 Tax=Oryza meyeriana var. granulata TaxID=110450 RepID=A0A6G1FA17_9ORYZ|nr:hypothetical protein E2562_018903 [Oryza meyeriana var. granulata]
MAVRSAAGTSRRLLPALLSPAGTCTRTHTAFLHSHATSFGYKQVPEEEKSKLVGNVFSSVASSYDLMNDLMSVGLHRLWKDRLISKLNPFPGMKHLDVAGGTGDVAFRVLERINSVSHVAMQGTLTDIEEDTQIYVCDINPNMLNVGKKRASEKGYKEGHCLSWIQGDAEALSFEDGSMDGYTIAFGIRNVTHIEKALSEAYRVLKRGGRFLCLELSHVDVPVFKQIYDVYSFSVIPAMGELVAGDRQSYQYLVESIRRFPNQEKFAQMIQEAGFERVKEGKSWKDVNTEWQMHSMAWRIYLGCSLARNLRSGCCFWSTGVTRANSDGFLVLAGNRNDCSGTLDLDATRALDVVLAGLQLVGHPVVLLLHVEHLALELGRLVRRELSLLALRLQRRRDLLLHVAQGREPALQLPSQHRNSRFSSSSVSMSLRNLSSRGDDDVATGGSRRSSSLSSSLSSPSWMVDPILIILEMDDRLCFL